MQRTAGNYIVILAEAKDMVKSDRQVSLHECVAITHDDVPVMLAKRVVEIDQRCAPLRSAPQLHPAAIRPARCGVTTLIPTGKLATTITMTHVRRNERG